MIYANDFFTIGNSYPNDDTVQLIDNYTHEAVVYKKCAPGIPVNGTEDGAIYRKKDNDFYMRQWLGDVRVAWWGIENKSVDERTQLINKVLSLGYDVFFDKMEITIKGKLVVNSNQKLLSNGCKIIQIEKYIEIFDCEDKEDIMIKGFVLTGHGDDYEPSSSSRSVGVLCYGAKRLLIEGNTFENFTYSAVSGLREVKHLIFRFNAVENSFNEAWGKQNAPTGRKDNTGITVGGQNITILKNRFKNSSQGIVIAEKSDFVSISDNDIENTILEHGMYVDAGVSNITIIGNRVRNTVKMGIKLQNFDYKNYVSHNIVISNNTIENTRGGGDGISINNTTGVVDAQLYAKNVVVSGNIVRNAGQHGINIRFVDQGVISNNVINDIQFAGVYISNVKSVEVCHNNIKTTAENGIMIEGHNTVLSVNSNTIENPGIRNTGLDDLLTGVTIRGFFNKEISLKYNKIIGGGNAMKHGVFVEFILPTDESPEKKTFQETYEIIGNTVLDAIDGYSYRFLNHNVPLRLFNNNYQYLLNTPTQA
ncbi:right-handed parallel beta-helix repeat-containing protein [Chryseobacterium jejuense]|uniref:Cofactor-binding repeat-containing protein n=1 Tax=Chryseobacterium jejuense TaxID=445960 RepID=A0A2X2XPA4_CHRJE|nr:right-handed parallel beta-helix repeat-containing protein [Chryseobacterium jejuense]SDI85055.1 putative cofactor-binding repeat-containing protein [Chryseobacterium jejuense]SQB27619.1 Uncharacterised protein [Chryseobacterium jejuense]